MHIADSQVEKLLAKSKKVGKEKLDGLREQATKEKKPLQDLIVANNLLSEKELTKLYAAEIGVMFGNPETTTGGNALKFYSSVRMDIRRIGQIKQGEEVIGNRTRVKVVKNKVAPPFRQAEFDIMYNQGISVAGDVLDLAAAAEIVEKSGAWYAYNGEKIGQGREATKKYLEENPKVLDELAKKVRAAAVAAEKE